MIIEVSPRRRQRTPARATARPPGRGLPGEREGERTQRQLIELLNEIRVAMPGVQVLFAFLLAVPFQARFGRADAIDRTLFAVSLVSAAIAVACFIASTAAHRVLFHHRQRDYIIRLGSRLLLAGLVGLALAMSFAVALVLGFIYGHRTGWLALALGIVLFGSMWFVAPAIRMRQTSGWEETRARAEG